MGMAVKKKLRAEAVMGIIIGCQLILLAALVMFCLPYIRESYHEDPEPIVRQNLITMPTQETQPMEQTLPQPALNPYGTQDFQFDGRYLSCLRADSVPGIDVSVYQGNIDWAQVADSGIEFVMIRVGYRGYGTGKLMEDTNFHKNIQGALAAGLDVGVYFFSQALNEQETLEEVDFLLQRIRNYEITMPVVFDWEFVNDEARTANMDRRTLTDCYLTFCKAISEAGYTPMSYFNTYQSRDNMYLYELEDYPFWLALYKNRMTFPYEIEMWQYTCYGRVPGIQGDVDINIYFP